MQRIAAICLATSLSLCGGLAEARADYCPNGQSAKPAEELQSVCESQWRARTPQKGDHDRFIDRCKARCAPTHTSVTPLLLGLGAAAAAGVAAGGKGGGKPASP